MKKALSMILALILCFSLCACHKETDNQETENRDAIFSQECLTVEEAAQLIAENYKEPADIKRINNNNSLKCYFQKDSINDKIWFHLISVLDESGERYLKMEDVYSIYEGCTEDDWFKLINVCYDGNNNNDTPMIMYGDDAVTCDYLLNRYKDQFREPDSVDVVSCWITFELPEGATRGGGFLQFEDGGRYQISLTVNGKNGFGGYSNQSFLVQGGLETYGFTYGSLKSAGLGGSSDRPLLLEDSPYTEYTRVW
jgi:hypothetical protein